jgi:tRNA-dihydrouridine synthase A
MREPALVRDCVSAMHDAVDIPVTVKTRLGVDECDSYDYFSDFVGQVAQSGCNTFIVHARKAWLSGLSPRENRDIPELRYEWVYRLKEQEPGLTIILNGGIRTVEDASKYVETLDGVMLGRAAYHTPWLLAELQKDWFDTCGVSSREAAVEIMSQYLSDQVELGVPVKNISRHLLGLFQGLPGARRWRRYISEHAHLDNSNVQLLRDAQAQMRPAATNHSGSARVHGDELE